MALVSDIYGGVKGYVIGSEEEARHAPIIAVRSAWHEYSGVYPVLCFRLDVTQSDGKHTPNLLANYTRADTRNALHERGYVSLCGIQDYLPPLAVPGAGAGNGYLILYGYTANAALFAIAELWNADVEAGRLWHGKEYTPNA